MSNCVLNFIIYQRNHFRFYFPKNWHKNSHPVFLYRKPFLWYFPFAITYFDDMATAALIPWISESNTKEIPFWILHTYNKTGPGNSNLEVWSFTARTNFVQSISFQIGLNSVVLELGLLWLEVHTPFFSLHCRLKIYVFIFWLLIKSLSYCDH